MEIRNPSSVNVKRYKATILEAEWRTDLWRDDDTFGLQVVVEFDGSNATLEFYGAQGEKVMRDLKAKKTLEMIRKKIAVIENEGWVQYDGAWNVQGPFVISEPKK